MASSKFLSNSRFYTLELGKMFLAATFRATKDGQGMSSAIAVRFTILQRERRLDRPTNKETGRRCGWLRVDWGRLSGP